MRAWFGLVLLLAVGCDDVSGHRRLLRWTSSGRVTSQPNAEAVSIGVWAEDGGFVRSKVTVLQNGDFLCEDAPRGEYYVELHQGRRWLVTDSRVLDLDEVVIGPVDAGTHEARQARLSITGGVAGLPEPVEVFSPDTNSFTTREPTDSTVQVTWAGFPSEGAGSVRSWFWQRGREGSYTGVARYTEFIGGWTVVRGLPPDDPLALELSLENELSVSALLRAEDFIPVFSEWGSSPWDLGGRALVAVFAMPRIAERPDSTGPRGALLGLDHIAGLPSSQDFALTTHNPFAGPNWQTQYSWQVSLSGRLGFNAEVTNSLAWGSATMPARFVANLTPPRAMTIDGLEAAVWGEFASSSPVVSWQAPERGKPSGYRVEFINWWGWVERSLLTRSTSVRLPPGFVSDSGVIRVVAMLTPNLSWDPHPPLDCPIEFTAASASSTEWQLRH